MTRYDTPRTAPNKEIDVVHPTDRIRWGPILAGVFAAITAAAVLSTLGAAIGMSAYDRGDDPRRFAIGAGVWGMITMVVAYCFGGWLTARSAAVRGRNNGLLNGAMVAGVGIPLMLFLLGSAGALMGHAEVANNRDTTAQARAGGGGGSGSGFDSAVQASGRMTPGDASDASSPSGGSSHSAQAEDAARAGSRAAWGTLVALLLAICASALGGYLGARDTGDRVGRATTT
jgi:hypothetical protein